MLSSSWAALKNVAANPRATPPPTTTSSMSSSVHSDATPRPTSRPVRCMISYVGSVGDRPVIASIANPDASASRQPAGAAPAAPPVGLDDDVPDVAGVGRRAVEQLAVEDDAAADPRRHGQHAVVVVTLGRALPALGEGERLAVELAVHTGAGELASRVRSGNSRHAGMLTGDTVSQCRVIGPAEPIPTHDTRTSWRSAARAAARRWSPAR